MIKKRGRDYHLEWKNLKKRCKSVPEVIMNSLYKGLGIALHFLVVAVKVGGQNSYAFKTLRENDY